MGPRAKDPRPRLAFPNPTSYCADRLLPSSSLQTGQKADTEAVCRRLHTTLVINYVKPISRQNYEQSVYRIAYSHHPDVRPRTDAGGQGFPLGHAPLQSCPGRHDRPTAPAAPHRLGRGRRLVAEPALHHRPDAHRLLSWRQFVQCLLDAGQGRRGPVGIAHGRQQPHHPLHRPADHAGHHRPPGRGHGG